MKVILTGATGLVGEGVLMELLAETAIERVLSLSRRPSGLTHDKLTEVLVPSFLDLTAVESQLAGYDACFYCAGISSRGMTETDYTVVTYDTPLAVAKTLLKLNPSMVMCHVSGASTDGSEKGRIMWARVKGKAENALLAMPFKAVYNFRPGLMKPSPGQKNVRGGYKVVSALFPVFSLVFPGLTMREVARAMIAAARDGADKRVLEARDMRTLAAR